MATYAVGDIQGCYDSFRRLLDRIGFDDAADTLWIAGDAVNRGPKSLKVLRWLVDHDRCVTMVLGNHDLHLLAFSEGLREKRKRDTFKSVRKAKDAEELLSWLRHRPFAHRAEGWLMIHAGLWPAWTVDDAMACAGEAEATLRGDGWREALASLYEGEAARWDPDARGHARFAAIVHGLTRLRYVDADGGHAKGDLGPGWSETGGALPWFAAPGLPLREETQIFGHWSTLGFYRGDGVVALDSGCVYGRHLTAFRLEDGAVFQVPSCEGP